jgi:hypothetical protein
LRGDLAERDLKAQVAVVMVGAGALKLQLDHVVEQGHHVDFAVVIDT